MDNSFFKAYGCAALVMALIAVFLFLGGIAVARQLEGLTGDEVPDYLRKPFIGLAVGTALCTLGTVVYCISFLTRLKNACTLAAHASHKVVGAAIFVFFIAPLFAVGTTYFIFGGSPVTATIGSIAAACACMSVGLVLRK
jgi:hypothetical protein